MATIANVIAHAVPPAFAAQDRRSELRAFMDELFGVPYSNPGYTMTGFDEQNKHTQSLPELLQGVNKTNLGERLQFLMLLADNFYTKSLAPVRIATDSLEVTWDTITFNPILPGVTPEQGRTRLATWNYSSESDVLQRMGVGAEFDYGFMLDARGQDIARGVMAQINNGVEEAMKFGVMHAYIRCGDMGKARQAQKFQQTWNEKRIDEMFDRERYFFGILQREEKAIQDMNIRINEEQLEYGGTGDTFLMHWKMVACLNIANELRTEFYRGGDAAVRRLGEGIDAFRTFGDSGQVFIVRAYDVNANGAVELLRERVVIGGHHLMFDPTIKIQNWDQYSTRTRSVMIMNADVDDYTQIDLEPAAIATGRWEPVATGGYGKMIGINDDFYMRKYSPNYDVRDMRDSFHYVNSNGDQVPIGYFGHMLNGYFPTKLQMALALTALKSATQVHACYNSGALACAIDNLVKAGLAMKQPEYDDVMEDWIQLLIQANYRGRAGERHPGTVGCPPTLPLTEWIPNSHGGMNLPDLASLLDSYVAIAPVGNLDTTKLQDNYPGFNFQGQNPAVLPEAGGIRNLSHFAYPNASLRINGGRLEFSRARRVYGRYPAPPLFANGRGFLTIADDVRRSSNREVFEKKYGFNYDLCKGVQDAVDVIDKAVRASGQVFLNNPLLDPAYTSSADHRGNSVKCFIDNLLVNPGVPVWLYAGQLYQPNAQNAGGVLDREGIAGASDATRVAAGRDSGRVAIATRLFEEAVGELAGLSGNYATLVKRNLTGSMGNLRDILGRYQSQLRATAPAGIRDDIPVVAPIGAKLTGPNVGNDATSDLFAFDPVQGSTDPAPSFARAVDINKLPLLARQAGPANGEWVDFAEGDQHINVYDEERLTRAGNADQGAIAAALQDVVRLLANFGPTIPAATEFTAKDATEFIASEATRAFVLMVLGLINTSPSAKKEAASVTVKNIALRVRAVINDLLGNGLGITATTTKVKPPAWDPQRFKTALATFLSQIESSDLLKALSIFGPHGTPSNFVKQIDSITQKMADARSAIEAFVESRAPAAADATGFQPTFSRAQSGLRHDSSQYMRSPLTASDVQFKTHWDYLWNEEGAVRRIPISLLSDPENPDAIVSPAVQKELSSRLAGAQGSRPIPAPLLPSNGVPSHTQGIDALPIIFNIRQYRKAIHGVNGPNQIDGFEAQARASENYTRSQATAIQYRGDRQLRSLAGNGAVSSKYRVTSVHTAGGDDDDNGPQDMDADRPAFTETFNRAAQRNKRGREAPRSAVAPAINQCINEKLDTEFLTDAFIQNWDELDRHSNLDSVLSVFAKLYLATPTDWRNWQAFLHHNVVFPMNILLARPFIVLHTMFMLKVKAGEDTAITWIARPVTSWGDDAQTQTYRLTLTYYTKTICHNKLNVYRIPNALICGYERGMNCDFYTPESFEKTSRELNGRDSIFALAEPYICTQLNNLINLGGNHSFAQFNFVNNLERNEASHYWNKYWANKRWGFQNFNTDEHTDERWKLSSDGLERFNLYMWAGQTLYYDVTTNAHTFMRAEKGYILNKHMGPGTVRAWINATLYPKEIGVNQAKYKPI